MEDFLGILDYQCYQNQKDLMVYQVDLVYRLDLVLQVLELDPESVLGLDQE